ncbi:helix-turn-helix domain-containing protein [Persicobacter psychrovividus]|uniref:helix-turn-helix domain-containing protein n=1 Tax=Persicobacter psychrovividus TaxID=387638 RepID=UPI002FCE4224
MNLILAGVFLTMALNILLQYYFRFTNLKFEQPQLLFICDVLDLMLPSFILWYSTCLYGKAPTKKHLWYFLPPFVSLIINTSYVLLAQDFSFRIFIGSHLHVTLLTAIVGWKAFVLYRIHQMYHQVKDKVNPKQKDDLLWPKMLIGFEAVILYIAVLQLCYHTLIAPFTNIQPENIIWQLVQLNYIIFNSSIIFLTMFYALKFPKSFSGKGIIIKEEKKEGFGENLDQYLPQLNELINEQSVHLDTELNERKLAEKMQIHTYLLSKVLNEELGKTFSEFINEHRVETAKTIIANDHEKAFTNYAIAVDSGFGSESVFYVNFKKITGMTPRQYRTQLRKMAS